MRSNALFQTRMTSRFRAGVPHRLICQMLRLAARADATGKEPRLGLFPAPVVTQRCEQFGAHWQIAILTTFAFSDMNHHAFAVDILDAKPDQFAPPDTSGVQQHEHDACLQIPGRFDESGYFLRAQHLWHTALGVLGVWNRVGRKAALQRAHEEKSQASHLRHNGTYR